MFNLIKKDFLVSIKGDGKSNIKYILIFLFMYFIMNHQSYSITPIFISYLIIANTFYNDYKNNNINFINSIPTSKANIVYSKYILAFITIIVVTTICSIMNFVLETVFHRNSVLNDIYYSLIIFIIIMSIVLPMYFKFGYHKVRTIAGFISVVTVYLIVIPLETIFTILDHFKNQGSSSIISFAGVYSDIFNKLGSNIGLSKLSLTIIIISTIIIFIVSMYISLKIIANKQDKINVSKFIKIATTIICVYAVVILCNKAIFKDMINENDYLINNFDAIEFSLENKYQDEEGIKLKFKIENPTKYSFRLDNCNISFPMYQNGDKEITTNTNLKINLEHAFEESDINWEVTNRGISPRSSGYVVFTIPKGLSLDSNYFDLNSIDYNVNGMFTVKLPFTQGGYITIRDFNVGGGISEVYLNELDINKNISN